uniref:Uncharacterized protein n=1 Tax=Anopheles quadriannulatus TaxID=34691 RepID=A0A182XTN2_ANOQN
MVVNTIRSQGAQMAQKVYRSCRCRMSYVLALFVVMNECLQIAGPVDYK